MVAYRVSWLNTTRSEEFARRYWRAIVAWLLLFAATGFAGFQQLFSSFATYDDEGYVLLSLRMFLAGRPLYDDIYTQYGPAYYVLQSFLHIVTGLPATHDVARWKTLVTWLVSAGTSAAFVQRVTGKIWLSAIAFLAVFFHLDRLGLEPGHPQDICLPILVGLLFISTFSESSKLGGGVVFIAGLLLGTIATTKLNLGIFCGASWMLAQLAVTRKTSVGTIAMSLLVLTVMILPFILLKHHAFSWAGAKLPFVVLVGVVGLTFAWHRLAPDAKPVNSSLQSVVLTLVTATAAATFFVILAWGSGTTLVGLYWGLIGQHAGFAADCYAHPPLPALSLAWALLALFLIFQQQKRLSIKWWLLSSSGVLIVLLQSRYWGESFYPVVHGLYDRGWASILAVFVPPIVSLLITESSATGTGDSANYRQPFARWVLAWNAVLQPLAMIPVPGTQVAIGTLPALLALFVLCSDLVDRLWKEGKAFHRISPNVAFKVIVFFAIVTLGVRSWKNWQRRATCESLQLAGTKRLCLPPEEAERIRNTVDHLRNHSDTFVTLPCGFNSLYLWTDRPPPTGLNTTVWDVLLNDRQQRQIIDAMEAAKKPRLVVYTDWPPVNRENAPLFRYLRENFTKCEVDGRSQIWKRDEKTPEPETNQAISVQAPD